jgi:hypothetical protein
VTRVAIILAALLLGATLPSIAAACENYVADYSLRATSLPDCSFAHAGHERDYSGFAARDIGNEKIAFRMVQDSSCLTQEKLVVVDCSSAEVLTIDGVLDPVVVADVKAGKYFLLGENRQIKYIQRPFGPISVTKDATIGELEQIAQKSGLTTVRDLVNLVGQFKRRERFDPYCGCKLFYPESTGAQN